MMLTEIHRLETPDTIHSALDRIRGHLNAALRGKPEVVERVLICLLARGHLLVEDKPGLGKTTLAKALAEAVGGKFARVQCTPDLLPSDITGFSVYNQQAHEFEFRPGPVFADVLLADEINRATPRTQSALLEAMAERQISYDGARYPLSPQFFVIATQNPSEQHGTYPLPEAQLDRFAMKLSIGYPAREDEMAMLAADIDSGETSEQNTEPILADGELKTLQAQTAGVAVSRAVHEYLVRLAEATRTHRRIELGLSPRGLLILQRMAQAQALLRGRSFMTPDDIQDVAEPVFAVRLDVDADDTIAVIREILETVPVPAPGSATR
jgi:MoxR-like ATPase